jgi:hypothetical protein
MRANPLVLVKDFYHLTGHAHIHFVFDILKRDGVVHLFLEKDTASTPFSFLKGSVVKGFEFFPDELVQFCDGKTSTVSDGSKNPG